MMKDHLQYGTSRIDYTLEYAVRKTLGIKVRPDNSVHVIAPLGTIESVIKAKVKSKASWILKQQDFFLAFHPITTPRKFVSGETHLYLGKQYRLKLFEAKDEVVKLRGGTIEIYIKSKEDKQKVERMLYKWYKDRAMSHFIKLFDEIVPLSKSFYNGTPILKYRWMKMRWGSCDKYGQIHLNLELIKAPKKCIEYVIIHELCHLSHLNHSKAFYVLLEEVYPDWKKTKEKLEKLMV